MNLKLKELEKILNRIQKHNNLEFQLAVLTIQLIAKEILGFNMTNAKNIVEYALR